MHRALLFSILGLYGSVIALSDVNQKCIQENSEKWSNDNLLGTWYRIWLFSMFGGMIPSSECTQLNFTRPTAEVLQEYKNKYNDPNLPYNLDDDPVLVSGGMVINGMVFGHNIAKFYVLPPNSTGILNLDGYSVDAYRELTPKYLMYTQCAMRGKVRWLMTRDRDVQIEEVKELVKITPELNDLQSQRFCDTS